METLYKRKILEKVRKWVDKKAVVVVTGMRQVGKTTLFKMLYSEIQSVNKAFLDMENPLNQKIFRETNYDNIWANLRHYNVTPERRSYILLDELQAMPEAVRAVKYLFDHYDVQFFVTGSSSYYLKNLFPESLAGRKVVFELFPLDFEEFLWFKGVQKEFRPEFSEKDACKSIVSYEQTIKLYEEYLTYGGFPRVVLAEDAEEKKAVIEDIYTSYFEKDVRSLADFKSTAKLQESILLLMQRTGSKLNVSKLASELGVSRETVYSYLSFLKSTYFISLMPPFSRSVDREVSGAKKVYLCDTGILNHMAQVSSGAILENAVFNSLKTRGEVNYYQKRTGIEIDFIMKKQGLAVEVKEKATVYDRNRLKKLAAALKLKESYVISKNFADGKGLIPATDL